MIISADVPPILQAGAVAYRYGTTPVLQDVTFQLPPASMTVLIGRNGAGKTTLLRCLSGWTRVYDGTITINGQTVTRQERAIREQVVFVPDTPDFYDALTAWEHLQFVAQLHRLPDWSVRAEALLHDFGLWTNRAAYPFTFSRGMRYKLALAMALLIRPPLLLLDEPFGPLDPEASAFLWGRLLALREAGTAVLLSSHALPTGDPADGYQPPDAFLIMEQGRIIAHQAPDQPAASLESVLVQALADQRQAASEAASHGA
jgi:ABC-2 type transport system ATP-binding protein